MHCMIAASREMSDEPLFFSLAFSCFVSIIAIIRSLRERTVAAWIDGKSFCFLFGASILYLWLWNFRPEIIRETYACMLLFILCTSVSNESLDTKHLTQAILGSSILFSLCTVTISVRMDKPVDCISHWIDSIADRVPDKHTGSSSSSYHLFFPQTILQMATGIASIYRFTIRWLILLQASIRKWTAVHLVYHCTTRSRTLLDREWSVQL